MTAEIAGANTQEHGAPGAAHQHNKHQARIDHETFHVESQFMRGDALLALVGKKPCAYDLIEVFKDESQNNVVLPDEIVDLDARGLKGFITAHKEIVTISITGVAKEIQRGQHTVTEILAIVGATPETHILLQEKDGQPPLPVPGSNPVEIAGCEVFFVQVQSGGSS
jgi:hypothetical protein